MFNILYTSIDLKLFNKWYGLLHYTIGVTCLFNGHKIYTFTQNLTDIVMNSGVSGQFTHAIPRHCRVQDMSLRLRSKTVWHSRPMPLLLRSRSHWQFAFCPWRQGVAWKMRVLMWVKVKPKESARMIVRAVYSKFQGFWSRVPFKSLPVIF